jgi:hypothetical protein
VSYIENYLFVYLPPIIDALVEYEQHREKYPSLVDYIPKLMRTFESIADRAGVGGSAHFR